MNLTKYVMESATDGNLWWRLASGTQLNLLDEAIDQLAECRRLLQFICDPATRNAGNPDNPFTYVWQKKWDEFEEAVKAGADDE